MDLESVFSELKEGHRKWWFDHQSPKTCIVGSDGVGHDLIHPADKLQAAYRNAFSMYKAVLDFKYKIAELHLELEKVKDGPRGGIKEAYLQRQIDLLNLCLDERTDALSHYVAHIKQLKAEVEPKYLDYDQALNDIWKARLLYKFYEKSHPMGHDLKIALIDEEEKTKFARELLPFPIKMQGGQSIDMVPDSKQILQRIEELKETTDGKNLLADIR